MSDVATQLERDERLAPSASRADFSFGLAPLLGCLVAALLMTLAQLDAVELPGCGTASDCMRAAESQWGTVPGTGWPLSFTGFAYFQALAATYVFSLGRLPKTVRWVVAAGGVVSVLLTAIMLVNRYLCGYCLTIHVFNIMFAIGEIWRERRRPASEQAAGRRNWSILSADAQLMDGGRPVAGQIGRAIAGIRASFAAQSACVVFAGTFSAVSLLLVLVERQSLSIAADTAQSSLQQALRTATEAGTVAGSEQFAPGRYRLGPEDARFQVVVVSDYQCPSCRTIDAQIMALAAERDDLSLSIRHFPFCTDCNPHIDQTRHPNACRAALAAEAAGQVGGPETFWRMHHWLFERAGTFSDEELEVAIVEQGINHDDFLAAFQSAAMLELIRSDAADSNTAKLKFTPMIFINGRPIDIGQ